MLNVETKIKDIDVYDVDEVDNGRLGHIDVRYWLKDEANLLAVADVRLYFKRTDVSLDDLTSSAVSRGAEIFAQVAQHHKSAVGTSSPDALW
jgi:hypothetical protein